MMRLQMTLRDNEVGFEALRRADHCLIGRIIPIHSAADRHPALADAPGQRLEATGWFSKPRALELREVMTVGLRHIDIDGLGARMKELKLGIEGMGELGRFSQRRQ